MHQFDVAASVRAVFEGHLQKVSAGCKGTVREGRESIAVTGRTIRPEVEDLQRREPEQGCSRQPAIGDRPVSEPPDGMAKAFGPEPPPAEPDAGASAGDRRGGPVRRTACENTGRQALPQMASPGRKTTHR
ncbi:hypothetical protein V5F89_07515 [Pelagerythrobacter marensis]|uniref:Uncharacterized protein n=1 Tax=Pelagerythrobacter marensis TaxID=543877 RepID=A0ABZ2D4H2_9SPHN